MKATEVLAVTDPSNDKSNIRFKKALKTHLDLSDFIISRERNRNTKVKSLYDGLFMVQ